MTQVSVNKKGVDVVDLSIRTYADPMAHFTTDKLLLDPAKDYVFAVTDLQVLCSEIYILPPDCPPITMTIKLRTNNGIPNSPLVDVPGGATVTANLKHRTVGSLVKQFHNFCRWFSHTHGLQNEIADETRDSHLLRISIAPGGKLQLLGSARFWQSYFIEFSQFANKAFSMDTEEIGGRFYLSHRSNVMTNNLVHPQTGTIEQSAVTVNIISTGARSIYPLLDQRTYITVETHMPTLNNVRVVDTKQRLDRSIFRTAFDQSLLVTLKFEESLIDEYTQSQKNYSGNVSFMDKSMPPYQWNVLQSSFELQIFRFELFVWYNSYNLATDTFKLKQYTPTVGHWDLGISFVSRY